MHNHTFSNTELLKLKKSKFVFLLTLALICVVPLLLLTFLPFLSPPSPFSLASRALLFLFSHVFPFLVPPLACEHLPSFSPLPL